eukprot:scaffold1168_cov167-Amphora_coffeaeformis.AAC.7
MPSFDDNILRRRILPYPNHDLAQAVNASDTHSQYPSMAGDDSIPEWIHSYLQWHQDTRRILNESNVGDYKFLVSRCYYNDAQCGGLTDRLRALPFLVQVAAMSGRILLIHWERPYDLSEFLEPAKVDWRLPNFVSVPRHSFIFSRVNDVPYIKKSPETAVSIRFQAYKEAEKFFDRYKVNSYDANMTQVLAPLWKVFFRPASPIQQKIDAVYKRYNLTVSNYVAAHLRTKYVDDTTAEEQKLVESVRNALACTSRFSKFSESTRIFVASDSREASQMAQKLAPYQVAVQEHSEHPPAHLDRGIRFLERPRTGIVTSEHPIEAYSSTFVDFYLLMGARCIAFDTGGFGRLATLLSSDPSCYFNHRAHKC